MWGGISPWLALTFPWYFVMSSNFSYSVELLYVFCGEMVFKVCCPFLIGIIGLVFFCFCNWIVRILYIVWTKCPYQIFVLDTLFNLILACLFCNEENIYFDAFLSLYFSLYFLCLGAPIRIIYIIYKYVIYCIILIYLIIKML